MNADFVSGLRACLAACIALIAVGGCSPKGAGGPSSASASGAPRIIIGQISPGTSQTPLMVAVAEGFFKKAGLDVTVQSLSGGTPSAMASFATGSVNMLVAGSPEFIEYAAKKVISGKMVAELTDQNYDIVVGKGITSLQQLKGKVIGISGANGADQVYLEAMLERNGMSAKDVQFITSGSTSNRLLALSTGTIQAVAASNANRDAAIKVGTVLLKSGDSPVQLPSSLVFASNYLISKHPEVLKTFVGAIAEATRWMRANPAAAAADCAKATGATVEACASAIAFNLNPAVSSKYTWSSTNAVNTAGIKSALEVMATIVPETKGLTVADVVDTSIAGEVP